MDIIKEIKTLPTFVKIVGGLLILVALLTIASALFRGINGNEPAVITPDGVDPNYTRFVED